MIPVNDINLFETAVKILDDFQSKSKLLGSNFGVAIAALMHRDAGIRTEKAPSIKIHYSGSGPPINNYELQTKICDPVFKKTSSFLPYEAEGPIYKPFSKSFKGLSPNTNNWRNAFDLQGGLGCDAPYTKDFLLNSDYLDSARTECEFRNPNDGTCESGSGLNSEHRTCFNPNKKPPVPGPESKAKPRPKLFRRWYTPSNQPGYCILEPSESSLALLAGGSNTRVPVYPFLCALYGGSDYLISSENEVDSYRLQEDLQLDDTRFLTLFDLDENNSYNATFLNLLPGSYTITQIPATQNFKNKGQTTLHQSNLSSPKPRKPHSKEELRRAAGSISDPARRALLLERANKFHERTVQAVADQLKAIGMSPEEQLDGFDLYAYDETRGYLFEIKTCSISNFRSQMRGGVAQLLEYRWRNREYFLPEVLNILTFDKQPPEPPDSWVWSFLNDQGIIPTWVKGSKLVTFPHFEHDISPLMP